MNRRQAESKFLDFIEGRLDRKEEMEMEKLLNDDPKLQQEFAAYKRLADLEKAVLSESFTLSENFVVNVMDRIESMQPGNIRSFFMLARWIKYSGVAVAACVCLLLILQQRGDFPTNSTIGNGAMQLAAVDPAKLSNSPTATPVGGTDSSGEEGTFPGQGGGDNGVSSEDVSEVISEDGGQGMDGKEIDPNNNDSPTVKLNELEQLPEIGDASQSGEGLNEAFVDEVQSSESFAGQSDAVPGFSGPGLPEAKSLSAIAPSQAASVGRAGDFVTRQSAPRRIKTAMSQDAGRGDEAMNWVNPGNEPAPGVPGSMPTYIVAEPYPDFMPPAPEDSRERYQTVEENKRVKTRDEAISTFSIDVDTGSYTNARRFLQMGSLPPAESVRVEEFLNYFDYNYPKQTESPFSLNYEIAPNPLDSERYLVKLGVKARDALTEKKAWNLIFLIDVSGSMADANKLPLVKQSLKLLVGKMSGADRIAIVTYAGSAGVALEPAGADAKQKILSVIDSLTAGGGTHGSGGIVAAYDLALRSRIPGGVNRVVLATDGDFNIGVSNNEGLFKLIEEKRRSGVTLTTLGFGAGNLNEGMMEQLANKGNGNYFYIDSFQEARKVFETDLVGTMEVVAKDVKIQIEFNPANVAEYRLIGYDNRRLNKEDFDNDQIDAGEIGTSHTVTALYEVVLSGSPLAKKLEAEYRYQKPKQPETVLDEQQKEEFGFLKIRYKAPDGDKSELISIPLYARDIQRNISQTSADFKFAAAVSGFGHLLRNSQYKGNYSMSDVVKLAQSGLGSDTHGYRREFIELVRNAEHLFPKTSLGSQPNVTSQPRPAQEGYRY